MKRIRFVVVLIFILTINTLSAQPIPPAHGLNQNQGGGAPIDNEVLFLILFAVIYACLKYCLIVNSNKKILK